jgi:hypothetical protein
VANFSNEIESHTLPDTRASIGHFDSSGQH